MSSIMKKIFFCIIGLIAGLAAWPVAEVFIYYQSKFPSFLVFSISVGLTIGLVINVFTSTSEGIVLADKRKIIKGMVAGLVVGSIGGLIGFLIAQLCLFIIGQYLIQSLNDFNTYGIIIARSIGWSILGIFIGITEGIRAGSFKKFYVGMIGGFLGGLVGGVVMEILKSALNNTIVARLLGFLVFGFFIGLFYVIIEGKLSYGLLNLLNGHYKGKDFVINQKKLKIGDSKKNDIVLADYNMPDVAAEIFIKRDVVYIKSLSNRSKMTINDDVINESKLLFGDVIKIGDAKFLYRMGSK